MAETLKPCPFCAGSVTRVRATPRFPELPAEMQDDPDATAFTIVCSSCASEGPWAKSESGARRLWNMRSARPSGGTHGE